MVFAEIVYALWLSEIGMAIDFEYAGAMLQAASRALEESALRVAASKEERLCEGLLACRACRRGDARGGRRACQAYPTLRAFLDGLVPDRGSALHEHVRALAHGGCRSWAGVVCWGQGRRGPYLVPSALAADLEMGMLSGLVRCGVGKRGGPPLQGVAAAEVFRRHWGPVARLDRQMRDMTFPDDFVGRLLQGCRDSSPSLDGVRFAAWAAGPRFERAFTAALGGGGLGCSRSRCFDRPEDGSVEGETEAAVSRPISLMKASCRMVAPEALCAGGGASTIFWTLRCWRSCSPRWGRAGRRGMLDMEAAFPSLCRIGAFCVFGSSPRAIRSRICRP